MIDPQVYGIDASNEIELCKKENIAKNGRGFINKVPMAVTDEPFMHDRREV